MRINSTSTPAQTSSDDTTIEARSQLERLSDQECSTVAGGRWVNIPNAPNPFNPCGRSLPIWVY